MGSYSRTVLLVINLLAAILALAVVGLTLNAMYGSGAEIPQLAGMPIQIYYAMIVFGGFVFFISILGVLGTCLHSKVLLSFFVILDLLLAIAFLVVAVMALVYANGVTTIEEIDSGAETFQGIVEETLYEQATKQPEVWNVTQVTLGCCGVDFKATYANLTELNVTSLDEYLDILQPGEDCKKGRDAVVALHAAHPEYTEAAQTAADAHADLQEYFCEDIIGAFVVANTVAVGVISGVLFFIMLSTASAAIILMTKVTTTNGGFVPPPQETGNSLAYGAKKGGPHVNTISVGQTLA